MVSFIAVIVIMEIVYYFCSLVTAAYSHYFLPSLFFPWYRRQVIATWAACALPPQRRHRLLI